MKARLVVFAIFIVLCLLAIVFPPMLLAAGVLAMFIIDEGGEPL
jgi:hypothetical protein